MQKVEGSSPFIRSPKAPQLRGFRRSSVARQAYEAGCTAQPRIAVMTTSATSLGWEIMATWEEPSISVTVAPMRS
jgi:hypothetical protein